MVGMHEPVTIPTQIIGSDGKTIWVFPDTWSAENSLTFESMMRDLAAEDERIAAIREAAHSPAAMLDAKRLELVAKKAARVALERDAEEDVIYAAAVKEHGGAHRVARVRTREGSIILRAMTCTESDRVGARINADGIKNSEIVTLSRDALRATVVHPPLPAFDKLVNDYASLWVDLYAERDRLTSGREDAAEKKA